MENQECFIILDGQSVENYLHENSNKILTKFYLNNNCLIYFLSSGKVVLSPEFYLNKDLKGIVFNDKKCYEDCIDKDQYPIENNPIEVAEKYKNFIEKINTEIDNILVELSAKFLPQGKSISNEVELSQILTILHKKKLAQKDLFFAAMALGEYVRRVNHGRWIILKKYGTYNPYYIPAIIYDDNSIFLLWEFLPTFFKNSTSTPEIFASLPYIKDPGLTLNNEFFKSNFYGYKKF
jgi:hypothetical protein